MRGRSFTTKNEQLLIVACSFFVVNEIDEICNKYDKDRLYINIYRFID